MSIQQRRLKKGWSQEDLARHSGLSTRTIQRIENGQNAGSETLKSLAAVFETSAAVLIQEQKNTEQCDDSKNTKYTSSLSQLENNAIKELKGIFAEPKNNKPDHLMNIERNIVNQTKNIINTFKKSN